jgi:hypothetical protein
MFQQFLGLKPAGDLRIYAVLEPTGHYDEPWIVKCIACSFTATSENHTTAVKVANWHDRAHDTANERQANRCG